MTTRIEAEGPSIGRLLTQQAQRYADAPAILFSGGAPLTYERLHQQVAMIGAHLRDAGVHATDRVAVVLPNGPGMAVAFLGVASAAACAPLNPAYTAAEFDFYLTDLDARAVIVPLAADTPVREVAQKRGMVILEFSNWVGPDGWVLGFDGQGESSLSCSMADQGAVALVLHTSGTTSRPKMIRLSHSNLCASATSIQSTLRLSPDDRCLNVMPLFHIHGLIGALLSSIAGGASVVCTPGFSSAHFFDWFGEFRPTWYSAVPTMHQEVLARSEEHRETITNSRLRFIRSSSAALSPEMMSRLELTFNVPVIQAFGMTEASHQIASNSLPPGQRKPGSVGLPTGCEVAILSDLGTPLPRGDSGEIAIRGPNVTKGIGPVGGDTIVSADQGWFRTGDLGFLDEDGYLFIAGRIKEIINRGGEKIIPAEVDHALLQHPAVGQAVTCAVPDARLGEDIIAVVVRRPSGSVTERELREFASTTIAAFKVPRRIMFVEQIPKGPTGKIQRIGLAKKLGIESLAFAQPSGSAAFTGPQTTTEIAIAQIWSQVLSIQRVGLHDNFFELGGDSLAAADVITEIEARLGRTVDIRDMGFGTLQQVAAACAAQATKEPDVSNRAGWVQEVVGRLWRKSQ
jgi:acyl-CoA synthetase (AMP-forming)/AMP-acid ligase II/acyl carrier protein